MSDTTPTIYQSIMPVSEAGGPHVLEVGTSDHLDDFGADTPTDALDPDALVAAVLAVKQKRTDLLDTIAREAEGMLTKRMGTRKAKENQWLEAMRIYLGSLSSYNIITGDYPFGTVDHPFGSRQDDSAVHRPEFNIIRQKCNMAIATTIAHQFAVGDKNWDIRPPQVIDIDPQDLQAMSQMAGMQLSPFDAAAMKARLMENEISYHLDETNYALECRKAMADRVIYGTGIMKKPFNAGKLKKSYVKQQTSDGQVVWVPKLTAEKIPCVYRVNLWYAFPDDSVTEIDKAEDFIEVHPMSKTELSELLSHPGYAGFEQELADCLKEEPRQYTNSPFNDPAYLTQGINLLKNKYLVIERHGPIKKEDLNILGLTVPYESPTDEVYAEVWVCNSRVIRLQLSAIEGSNKVPYTACVWEADPATIFGFGIPMLARDQQRVVNETYKMVLDNAGISAGPQVVVDTTIIKPAEGGMECTPFKVWLANDYGADTTKAIQFFMPDNAVEQLSGLISLARGFADEESSINLLTNTAPAGGVDSATGQALIDENAMAPLFYKSEEWDDNITRQIIQSMYDWEMQYNPKDEIKGTYCIDVRTTTAYARGLVEQQKLTQLFQEVAQGSPISEWINMDELIQARLSTMHLPWSGVIRCPQEVMQERQQKAQQPPPPDPNMIKAQALVEQNEIAKQKLQLEQAQFNWQQQQHVQDKQIDTSLQFQTLQSEEKRHAMDLQSSLVTAGVQKHATDIAAATQAHQANVKLVGSGMQESTKRAVAASKAQQHQATIQSHEQIAYSKIASEERKSHEKAMMDLRLHARDNAAPRKTEVPNRNLTEHNAKPRGQ